MRACDYLVVDGHSVLFTLSSSAKFHAANPRKARQRLVRALQQFQDFSGIQTSVVFDGTSGGREPDLPGAITIRYAQQHQTADALIERAVSNYKYPEKITVVTADRAEGSLISSTGAQVICPEEWFDWLRSVHPEAASDFCNP